MSNDQAAHCRRQAAEMRARAAKAATPYEREQYREISIAWEALAAEAERQAKARET